MEAEFLTGDAVESALLKLLKTHQETHWAVAWGAMTAAAKALLSRPSRLRAVTFGLAFSQTDPDLVDKLIGLPGCRVVKRFPKGTYHPKVYIFRSGEVVEAIVGSANFTRGGLGQNHEASVRLSGTINDKVLADLLKFTAQSAALGVPVTRKLADDYRVSCQIAARKPKAPRDPLDDLPSVNLAGLNAPLTRMTWHQYVRAVHRADAPHPIDECLALLETVQTWLSTGASFRDLSIQRRKAIAGVIGQEDRSSAPELQQDWGWFGSMRGAGDFMNRVAQNDDALAMAFDVIPLRGEVRRADYDRFAELFVRAFANSDRTGGVATASRLLAMKRPDVFLCISNPNRTRASQQMAFAKTTLDLETYWDRVVEVIRASDWYDQPKPENRHGRLWECRAAMLDALFYSPD
ncbi:phospholipase D family protein [Brevundimonas sp.]|uniref:phospholipase D family protein n=1 Tax=Brevundimonas sp. TaxID=1871086 RepID=UPI0028989402|nr:phospholipase D family protein [Brevundimonas sp.]